MLLAVSWWYQYIAPHVADSKHNDFIWGVVHGIALPLNFFYSLVNHKATIYQAHNTGGWYNAGFLGGAWVFWLGGATAARRRRH